MPDFDLPHAAEVLSSKYNAMWVDTSPIHKSLEAEVSLPLRNETLLIEIAADATTLRAISIRSFDAGTIKPQKPPNLENKTNSYAMHPQVVAHLEEIKADLGIPKSTAIRK